MFDIGFWEIFVIGVVVLLVLGPERLPEVARTMGLWLGKIKRTVQSVKDDIKNELELESIKKNLNEQINDNDIKQFADEASSDIKTFEKQIKHSVNLESFAVNSQQEPLLQETEKKTIDPHE